MGSMDVSRNSRRDGEVRETFRMDPVRTWEERCKRGQGRVRKTPQKPAQSISDSSRGGIEKAVGRMVEWKERRSGGWG
jgi:hypothetical protein